jgi:hypothetical protein
MKREGEGRDSCLTIRELARHAGVSLQEREKNFLQALFAGAHVVGFLGHAFPSLLGFRRALLQEGVCFGQKQLPLRIRIPAVFSYS